MNCPKCRAVVSAGASECSACGIIFSRWLDRPVRPSLSTTPVPPPIADEPLVIPKPAIIAGVILFIFIGILWTSHRHAVRASENGSVSLDHNGQAERNRLGEEAWKASQDAAHDRAVAAKKSMHTLPSTLTEDDLRALIEADPMFQDNILVSVPKYFDANAYRTVSDKYPALASAKSEGLIEFDPPFDPNNRRSTDGFVEVKIPSMAYYNVEMIRDRGDTYEIDLGKRKLDTVTLESATDVKVKVAIAVSLEHEVAAKLGHGTSTTLHAYLSRGADGWRLDSIKTR